MKKNLTAIVLFAVMLTATIGFSSCSKDKKDDVVTDPTAVLTSKVWKSDATNLDIQTSDLAAYAKVGVSAISMPSELTFKSGGVLNYLPGLHFSDTQSVGTWTVSADFKTVTLKDSQAVVIGVFTVIEATSTSVKLQYTCLKTVSQASSDVNVVLAFIPKV